MLKTKTLNELLSQNVSSSLSTAFICTHGGSLIAYSTRTATPLLERQAILAGNIWATYPFPTASNEKKSADHDKSSSRSHVTLELAGSTLSLHLLKPSNVLLCAFGPPPPPPAPLPNQTDDSARDEDEPPSTTSTSDPLLNDLQNPSQPNDVEPITNGEASMEDVENAGSAPEMHPDPSSTPQTEAAVSNAGATAERESEGASSPAELTAQATALAHRIESTLGSWRMPAVELT
ncbi:MAG: hypothetical protein M4579_000384 [Chaenotheca gracillima]|nr:MAG: hypothetical protein M4579_000384 [Chaenotheca gracillima]